MLLEIVGVTLAVVDAAVKVGVNLRLALRAYRMNADAASGIVARLWSIASAVRSHQSGGRRRAAVWSAALRRRAGELRAFCVRMDDVGARLEGGSAHRFLQAKMTAALIDGLLDDVIRLQEGLHSDGFFIALRDETVPRLEENQKLLRQLLDIVRAQGAQQHMFIAAAADTLSATASVPGAGTGVVHGEVEKRERREEDGLQLGNAVPRTPVSAALSATAVCSGLDLAFDASVAGGWKDVAVRFAEGAENELRRERQRVPHGLPEVSTVLSSRVSTNPGAARIWAGRTVGNGEFEEVAEEVRAVERLEDKKQKFLFKLSHSSLSEEERMLTSRLVDALWGIWRVDVADIVRVKDEEGQFMEIGDGCYGRVYKGTKKVRDVDGAVAIDTPVAIKILHKEKSQPGEKAAFLREALLMREAAHENVVNFMGAHWPADGVPECGPSLGTRAFLVTELMTGTLQDAMKSGVLASFDVSLWAMVCIAHALEFLHSKRILHQDLKAENILCNFMNGELLSVKVADFGVSRMLRRASTRTRRGGTLGGAGTLHFMPPEAILASGVASFAVDVWSLGILMAQIVLSEPPPTMNMDDFSLRDAALNGTLAPMLETWMRKLRSRTLSEVCIACIHHDPQRRPDVAVIRRNLLQLQENGESLEKVHHSQSLRSSLLAPSFQDGRFFTPEQGRERKSDIRGDLTEASTFYKRGCELFFGSVDGDQGLVDGVKFLVEAAQLMHVDAMAHVGYCYLEGVGVPVNVPLGLQMLDGAARGGSYEAHNSVGHCLQFGVGFTKDLQRAVSFYQYAASAKEASALTNLGFCYLEGCGVERDQQRAFGLFQEAADCMHPVALAHLGLCHQFGLGTATSRGEAERNYLLGAETVQLPQRRPPTFCCSAQYQYMGNVKLVATKVYPVPLPMFRRPAQARLTALLCLPVGQYQEFSNLVTKAADAGDLIGFEARPMVKSLSATLPILSEVTSLESSAREPNAKEMEGVSRALRNNDLRRDVPSEWGLKQDGHGGGLAVDYNEGNNFMSSLATSFLSSSAPNNDNSPVDLVQAGPLELDLTQRKHVTRRVVSCAARRRMDKGDK